MANYYDDLMNNIEDASKLDELEIDLNNMYNDLNRFIKDSSSFINDIEYHYIIDGNKKMIYDDND
jgi:hypothetical protein